MIGEKLQKVAERFYCKECDYTTSRLSSWNKHLETRKHKKVCNDSKSCAKVATIKYRCSCGKGYKYDSGYYRHKKVCTASDETGDEPAEETSPAKPKPAEPKVEVEEEQGRYMFSREELVSLMRDVVAEASANNPTVKGNNNNVVIGDQTHVYTINLFLNENCKDAMTIQHFLNSISLGLNDLEVGKSHALASTLIRSLEPLAVTERPFHRTENEDEWFVNDEEKGWNEGDGDGVLECVDSVISKRWPSDFEKQHPNWMNDPKLRDRYVAISSAAVSVLNERQKKEVLSDIARSAMLTESVIDSSKAQSDD
jgi:hypothetical protein